MEREEMQKHMQFLNEYAHKHKIIFRVSRSGVSVEDIAKEYSK